VAPRNYYFFISDTAISLRERGHGTNGYKIYQEWGACVLAEIMNTSAFIPLGQIAQYGNDINSPGQYKVEMTS